MINLQVEKKSAICLSSRQSKSQILNSKKENYFFDFSSPYFHAIASNSLLSILHINIHFIIHYYYIFLSLKIFNFFQSLLIIPQSFCLVKFPNDIVGPPYTNQPIDHRPCKSLWRPPYRISLGPMVPTPLKRSPYRYPWSPCKDNWHDRPSRQSEQS